MSSAGIRIHGQPSPHRWSSYVAEHLSLDSMVREFAKVDAFIRRRNTRLPRPEPVSPAVDPHRS